MTQHPIFITENDYQQLVDMIKSFQNIWTKDLKNFEQLQGELHHANVLPSHLIGHDVITMNSVVSVQDIHTGHQFEYQLVFPQDADLDRCKLSVLSPVGTALLGYRVGDQVRWTVPDGERAFEIKRILYQPEASGEDDV
jgi:regulator of nucleoside diphosphate kinase